MPSTYRPDDGFEADLAAARTGCEAAGLHLDVWHCEGQQGWTLFRDGRLVLTWLPFLRRAVPPSNLPSVPCPSWRQAIALAQRLLGKSSP